MCCVIISPWRTNACNPKSSLKVPHYDHIHAPDECKCLTITVWDQIRKCSVHDWRTCPAFTCLCWCKSKYIPLGCLFIEICTYSMHWELYKTVDVNGLMWFEVFIIIINLSPSHCSSLSHPQYDVSHIMGFEVLPVEFVYKEARGHVWMPIYCHVLLLEKGSRLM